MLDKNSHVYPDSQSILGTCKTVEYSKRCEGVLRKHFTDLYEEQMRYGISSDSFMEKYGFEQDRDVKGNIVRRTSSCEAWQRAKNLSHIWQRELREKNVVEHELMLKKKIDEAQKQLTLKHDNHAKMLSLLASEQDSLQSVSDIDFEHITKIKFAQCTIVLLQAFIYVREFIGIRVPQNKGFEWPKGKSSIVDYAYQICMKSVILPQFIEECEQIRETLSEDPTRVASEEGSVVINI